MPYLRSLSAEGAKSKLAELRTLRQEEIGNEDASPRCLPSILVSSFPGSAQCVKHWSPGYYSSYRRRSHLLVGLHLDGL